MRPQARRLDQGETDTNLRDGINETSDPRSATQDQTREDNGKEKKGQTQRSLLMDDITLTRKRMLVSGSELIDRHDIGRRAWTKGRKGKNARGRKDSLAHRAHQSSS